MRGRAHSEGEDAASSASCCSRSHAASSVSVSVSVSEPVAKAPSKPKRPKHVPKKCVFEGCSRLAAGKGYCRGHGGGRRCRASSCHKTDVGGGYCMAHGGGKRCEFPNCSRGAQGVSMLCKSHGGGLRCSVPGCTSSAQSGGKRLCIKHGGGLRCCMEGCNCLVRRNRLCRRHLNVNHNSSQPSTRAAVNTSQILPLPPCKGTPSTEADDESTRPPSPPVSLGGFEWKESFCWGSSISSDGHELADSVPMIRSPHQERGMCSPAKADLQLASSQGLEDPMHLHVALGESSSRSELGCCSSARSADPLVPPLLPIQESMDSLFGGDIRAPQVHQLLYFSFLVADMKCAETCGMRVQQMLSLVPGVISVNIHFPTKTASVQVGTPELQPAQLKSAINLAGFHAECISTSSTNVPMAEADRNAAWTIPEVLGIVNRGCPMSYGGECLCDPAKCRCFNCNLHADLCSIEQDISSDYVEPVHVASLP
jgi:copper chaperone CopZ